MARRWQVEGCVWPRGGGSGFAKAKKGFGLRKSEQGVLVSRKRKVTEKQAFCYVMFCSPCTIQRRSLDRHLPAKTETPPWRRDQAEEVHFRSVKSFNSSRSNLAVIVLSPNPTWSKQDE